MSQGLNAVSLGQGGSVYQEGSGAIAALPTGMKIIAITAVGTDAVFSVLTPSSLTGIIIGNTTTAAQYNGDAFTTLTDGITIYGQWDGLTLTSGNVIAYFG